jgi:hypothetical protein
MFRRIVLATVLFGSLGAVYLAVPSPIEAWYGWYDPYSYGYVRGFDYPGAPYYPGYGPPYYPGYGPPYTARISPHYPYPRYFPYNARYGMPYSYYGY